MKLKLKKKRLESSRVMCVSPKMHKPNAPLRPTVSKVKSYIHFLFKLAFKMLTSLCQIQYSVRDTFICVTMVSQDFILCLYSLIFLLNITII